MKNSVIILKFGMYLLSLWLLFILIIVNKIDVHICFSCNFANKKELLELITKNILPLTCIFSLFISLLFYLHFINLIGGSKNGPYVITEIEDKSSEHLVFLATYVIPLVGFSLNDIRQIVNFYITLFILGAIYIRTNLFYANPTLSLLGFKIFSAKVIIENEERNIVIISREEFDIKDAINTYQLDKKVYFAKKSIKVKSNENNR